jgi:hypothetical protein
LLRLPPAARGRQRESRQHGSGSRLGERRRTAEAERDRSDQPGRSERQPHGRDD